MLRHWSAGDRAVEPRLVYSSRSLGEVIYRNELTRLAGEHGAEVQLTLTRTWPEHWDGHRGRIDREMLEEVAWAAEQQPLVYVCGPSSFVEAVASTLVDLGHDASRIRTERFGPTGT
jgi:ferredoxin-NADP reductase